MPIYSDSDDQAQGPSHSSRMFGHRRPLHSMLGGRRVADILLWRNKTYSASILAAFSIIWFLFEVVELHFITVACYLLMTFMLSLCIWIQAASFFKWRPPTMYDIQISESTGRHIISRINKSLTKFYRISCGENFARFFVVLVSLWLLSIFGSYSSALNVLYVVFLGLITIPILYERYEREVGYIATQGKGDMKRLYKKLDTKFLSKIPRGPIKEKKYM
ncbi:reticulon-like protein B14 [Beta vulgaris subsp. vulgaris]|uniref:reticulon-like protein B14 n=1 Tax=Beta vulgaris subsp. vulgaris TaxID=3555 RepID=UPI002036DA10|nr:reticulon-like protein B14 [Beta vulgaris subsp. vulgaris]